MMDYQGNLTADDAASHCKAVLPSLAWDAATIAMFCQCNLVDAARDDKTGQWLVGLCSLDSLLRYVASVKGLGRD